MKKFLLSLLLLIIPSLSHALDYSLATDYCFINQRDRVFIDTFFTAVAGAEIDKRGFRGSDLHYAEGGGAIFINAYPAEKHALSFELGYSYMRLKWDKNPAFNQDDFNDAIFSIGYITTAIERWRWVVNLGIHANIDHFNIGRNAFYTGTIWGRLAYSRALGVHIGFVGQSGVKSTYLFPILGVDWAFAQKWKANLIFPLDFSLHYYFSTHWSTALSYTSFGGWYRSFHRVGSHEPLSDSMVSVHAGGIDLGINFSSTTLSASLVCGGNFGGWFLIRNSHGAKPVYFHFDAAPYAAIKAALEF